MIGAATRSSMLWGCFRGNCISQRGGVKGCSFFGVSFCTLHLRGLYIEGNALD